MRGQQQSVLEAAVPEQFFADSNATTKPDGVSTVKALATAAAQGQKIFTITSANIATALPQLQHSASVMGEIQNAIAAGKEVTISEKPVTVGGWTGAGYAIVDPATGAGAYLIEGGANGGEIAKGIASTMSIILFFAKAAAPLVLLWTLFTVTIAVTVAIIDANVILYSGGKCSEVLADFSLKISLAFALAGLFVSSKTAEGVALKLLTIMYGGDLFKGVAGSKACL